MYLLTAGTPQTLRLKDPYLTFLTFEALHLISGVQILPDFKYFVFPQEEELQHLLRRGGMKMES